VTILRVDGPIGYDFSADLTAFDEGAPQPTDKAIEAWKANPSPRNWPFVVMHGAVTRTIRARLRKTTDSAVQAEMTLISAACQRGSTLVFKPDGKVDEQACKIYSSVVSRPPLDQAQRVGATLGIMYVTVDLLCTPYWLGPEIEVTIPLSPGAPFTGVLSGVTGDAPALARYWLTHAMASTRQDLSLKSNPDPAFDPTLAFGSVVDANAYGPCADLTMGASNTLIGSPPSLDVGVYRGDYHGIVRVKSSAPIAANVKIHAVSTVQGNVGDAYTVPSDALEIMASEVSPTLISGAGFETVDVGPISIPAGRVQAGLSGTTFGNNITLLSQLTHSSAQDTLSAIRYSPSFTVGRTTQISRLKVWHTYNASQGVQLGIYDASKVLVALAPFATAGAAQSLTVDCNIVVPAGTYYVGVSRSPYTCTMGGSATTGNALYCVVTGAPAIASGASVGIEARQTVGANNMRLDPLILLPTDEGLISVVNAFGAGEGMVIDLLSEDPADFDIYIGNATDSGISLVGKRLPHGGAPMLPRPNVDNMVVGMVTTDGSVKATNASLVVKYRERRYSAFTGN
jgi:hypothetical protein